MIDVPGAIGVLCSVMWSLTTPLVPAWDALLHNTYLAAILTTAAWVLFGYILTCPSSTLVSRLARHVNYFGHTTPLLSAAYLFTFGLCLFIAERPLGLFLTVASAIIANLSWLDEAADAAMEDHDLGQREPQTVEPSHETSSTAKTTNAPSGASAKAAIWAFCRCILNCVKSLLLVSTLGFIASQFIVSIAVTSLTTHPIFIDFSGPQVVLEVNITEVTVPANVTESKTRISIPVNTTPDFITVFGSPTQAVPTPAPVAKATWAPAASSTPMPTPEPTPSRVPEPEPEPEHEPEPEPEPQELIAPDELYPVFEYILNESIYLAKAIKALWLDLKTGPQYTAIAIAGSVAWTFHEVLAYFTAASTITAVASYISSLLFPILKERGLTNDRALVLCISLALDMIMIATTTLWRLSRRGQQSRINATVDNTDQDPILPVSSSTDNNHLTSLCPQSGGEQPEVDDNIRIYIEGIVAQQATKLAHDVQLHATIANAVLLALQGADKMPMHAAAWNHISQQMWCHFVQQTVTLCLREQQQEQERAHTNNPQTEARFTAHWPSSSSSSPGDIDDNLEDHPDTRDTHNDGGASPLPDDTTDTISGIDGGVAGLLPDSDPEPKPEQEAAHSGEGGLLLDSDPEPEPEAAHSGEGGPLADDASDEDGSRGAGAQRIDIDDDDDEAHWDTCSESDEGAEAPAIDLDGDQDGDEEADWDTCSESDEQASSVGGGDEAEAEAEAEVGNVIAPEDDTALSTVSVPEDAAPENGTALSTASVIDPVAPGNDTALSAVAVPEDVVAPENDTAHSAVAVEAEDDTAPWDTTEGRAPEGTSTTEDAPVAEDEQDASDAQQPSSEQHDEAQDDDEPELPASPENQPELEAQQQLPSKRGSEEPADSEQDGAHDPSPSSEEQHEPEQQAWPEKEGALSSPSSPDDDVNDINDVSDTEEAAEGKDCSSDGQGGDSKDAPTPSTAENGPVAASPPSSENNCVEPPPRGTDEADGELPGVPSMDSEGGDNNDTPLPTPSPARKKNKGLAGSRFADHSYEPEPINPVEEGLWAARFAKEQPSTSNGRDMASESQLRGGGGNEAKPQPSTSTGGGEQGDNSKEPPHPAPPPVKKNKGLAGSRFASEQPAPSSSQPQHEAGTPPAPSPPTPTPSGSQQQQPWPATTLASSSAEKLCQDLSTPERLRQTSKYWHECIPDPNFVGKPDGKIRQYYRTQRDRVEREHKEIEAGTKRGRRRDLPVEPFKFPEDPEAAYRNPQPTPTSSPSDYPAPKYLTTAPKYPKSDPLPGPEQPTPAPTQPSSPAAKEEGKLRQDLSSVERLRQTSKYWHECLPRPNLMDKPDGKIGQYYRTENNRIERDNREIDEGRKKGWKREPCVLPLKFPGNPEAAYRSPQPTPTTSPADFPRPRRLAAHAPGPAAGGAGSSSPGANNGNQKKNGGDNGNNNRKNGGGRGGKWGNGWGGRSNRA